VSPSNVLVARDKRSNGAVVAATDPVVIAAQTYVANNPDVSNIIAAYKADQAPLANKVIATITAGMTNSANTAGEMDAGDLIADAQL
ncbi:hypothetical protein ABTK91_20000, partial [Acinetobacter baumannii]